MARFEVLFASFVVVLVVHGNQASLDRELSLDDPLVKSFIAMMSTPFNWEDCGNKDMSLKFNNFTIKPDPVAVPGVAQVTLDTALTRDVNAPVKISMMVQKKVIVWVKLPCEHGMYGSCTFDDICPILEKVVCDENDRSDVTCHCPFKKGTYTLPTTPVTIDDKLVPYPWSVVRGQYKVKIDVSDSQGPVGCLSFQLTLG